MNPTANDPLLLLGRILGSAIFVLAGWGKLMAATATKAHFAELGVPLPELAYYVAVAVELGGGLLLLLGLQTRLVALVLAVFCVATALLAHTDLANTGQFNNFMKNMAMTGGYLAFAAAGAGRFSLDALTRRRQQPVRVA